jgi:hypothetical protein
MIAFLRNLVVCDFWLKLFSLALAVLIWLTVSFAIRQEVPPATGLGSVNSEELAFPNIPVLVVSTAADVRSFKVNPSEVQIKVRGEPKKLRLLQASDIRALVDLTGIESARGLRKRIAVTTPPDVTFVQAIPDEVEIVVPPKH